MSVISVKNISKSIRNKKIVNDVSFDIDSGTIVGLVGRNGAGKTSIMKCITGLYNIDEGSITLSTHDIDKERDMYLSCVGSSIEVNSFYEHLSGYENLYSFSLNPKNITNIVNYIGLKSVISKPVSTYSLGMKARLSIGISILNNPDLIVLDEPTNGLDPSGIIDLRNILMSLKDEGKTIIISSHILSEIEKICDEIYFICGGEIAKKVKLDNNVDLEKIYNEVERNYDAKRYLC